jgi:hypothetical protein
MGGLPFVFIGYLITPRVEYGCQALDFFSVVPAARREEHEIQIAFREVRLQCRRAAFYYQPFQ